MSGHLRPRFHVRPPTGYLNDPNGPVLLDDTYHLYFQYRTTTDLASPVLWGHATSRDLAHWELHRPAMAPHPTASDRDGCWSGSTVVDESGRLSAFYSGLRHGHPYQSVLRAVSADGGATFGDPVQVVADPGDDEQVVTFRDPFVWRTAGGWSMVVGAGDAAGVASVRSYTSSDLTHWTYAGVLARLPRTVDPAAGVDTGVMWECPQVLDCGGQVVVLAGAWTPREGTLRVYALSGLSAGVPAAVVPLDAGPDFYAPSVLRDAPGGPLLWGWAREARPHAWAVEDGWSGALTLPRRVLGLAADGGLRCAPVSGLERLRATPAAALGSGPVGAQAELEVRAAERARVRLRFGPTEWLDVEIDPAGDRVLLDRDHAACDPRAVGGTYRIDDAFGDGPADVRIFLDGSLVEVFTGGGRVATIRCYPGTPPPWRVEVSGEVVHARQWQLEDGRAPAPGDPCPAGRLAGWSPDPSR